jgi:hypothetical protein
MTLVNLKPFLIVLAIGLLVLSFLPDRGPESGSSLGAHFERLVDDCRAAHPDWGRDACESIVRGDLWVGMTEEMILAALGEPRSVEIPDAENPSYKEWSYYTARYGREVLYVEDGLLTGWGTPDSGCPTCGIRAPRP